METELQTFLDRAQQHFAAVASRIENGNVLLRQFQRLCRNDLPSPETLRQISEKANELAVAEQILLRCRSEARVSYEPSGLSENDRRIDFVVQLTDGAVSYIEVKTIHPRLDDTDESWDRYIRHSEHFPTDTEYLVDRDMMGAAVYGASAAARAKFLDYSLSFESRLSEAKRWQDGTGILLFAGTGARWRCDELEDFADYYHSGQHRPDDPFAAMEARHIAEHSIRLQRNITHFGCVVRALDEIQPSEICFPVMGPKLPGRQK